MISYPEKMRRILDRMGTYYLDDLLALIEDGHMQSFVIGNSWAVTQIADFPRTRRLEVVAMVGDLHDGEAMHTEILGYAEQVGAKSISALGRVGWFQHAVEHGWRIKARNLLYVKDL